MKFIVNDKIKELYYEFFGREMTPGDLRLLLLIHQTILSKTMMSADFLSDDDYIKMKRYFIKGYVFKVEDRLLCTKEFYDFMNEIVWESYVDYYSLIT